MHASTRPASSPACRRTAALAAAALTAATTVLLAAAGPAAASTVAVSAAKQVPISGDTYTPALLTVKLGDTVTWKNLDARPHTVTVTSGPDKFDSGPFAQGKTWSHTFTELGTYEYFCSVHPDMAGTVHATASGRAPTTPRAGGGHDGHPASPGTGPGGGLLGPLLPGSVVPATGPAATAESDPVAGVIHPFQQHLVAAHLTRTAEGQVEDLLAVDSYVRSHSALLRMMLDGFVGKSSPAATSAGTGPFMQHMDAAHWNRSPGEQVSDISRLDRWTANHVALVQRMLGTPGTGHATGDGQ
jgi:plastocyanin